MLIESKYAGECKACRREVRIGDRVSWTAGEKGVTHAACSAEGRALAPLLAKSAATDAALAIPAPDGLQYLGYQKAGIAYALEKGSAIIADEMGLGKTIQAIGLLNADPTIQSVLVVCPRSLAINWRRELDKWRVTSAGVAIVTYGMIGKVPANATYDLLILDESHYIKNPKSQRTAAVMRLRARCKRVLCLTGTPILNRPVELWPMLQLVAPKEWDPAGIKGQALVAEGEGAGFFKFAKRYCDAKKVWFGRASHWDFSGASNLVNLQERLRATCMVRRLKQDVLAELPPKQRQVIPLDADKSTDALLREELEYFGDDLERAQQKTAFEDIANVRKTLAARKVEPVADHVRDLLEGGVQKIVVFAHHLDLVHGLREALLSYNAVAITGAMPGIDRQRMVDAFQGNPDVRVIVGTIGAMGVGLTLTEASTVVFAELDWTPATVTQAEDRVHRLGQRGSVLVQHLVFRGSIDERMVELIRLKQEICDAALDDATMQDVSDRGVVERRPEPDVSEYRRHRALQELRFLAARCDGAQAQDGMGFNGLDTAFGKKLAALAQLSPRQTVFAESMLKKYSRQLEGFR